MTAQALDTEVLVVGAGPTGLLAALCLQRMGVAVTVIDAKDGPTRESRALGIQARTLEILDQLGIAAPFLEQGREAPAVAPGSRSRTFGEISLNEMGAGITPYPGILVLEQSRTERILGDVLAGGVRWRSALDRLEQTDDGVVALLEGGARIRARYCIGADGASSAVRKQLGIAFEGSTNAQVFFVADALGTSGLVDDAINLRVSADHILLSFPMTGDHHDRLLGVAKEADVDEVRALVERRLSDEFGVRYRDLAWFATYHVHHRVAARFRSGAVFLAGDAAHVHSPVGAQGMNTGLQDAHNLACKLADVLRRGRPGAILEDYEAERRPVAAKLVATTDRLFATITSERGLARFVRGSVIPAIGPLAVRLVPRIVGTKRIFGYLSQTRIHYRTLTVAPRGDRVVGRRLPWTGENYTVLRALDWQVHGYGADPVGVAAELGLEAHGFGRDPHRRLRSDLLYLVRPDGFVAAAAVPGEAAAAFAALV